MVPTSRKEFKELCLRRLGGGVTKVNISEMQADDCVDRALFMFHQYHMEGTEKTFYKYQMTQTDINNSYITLPENIIGAVRIFPIGDGIGTNSLFNMRYQFVINDLYNFANVSLVPYYMIMNHVQFMEEMLVGQKPIRFNRYNNILYLDMDMSIITEGEWLIVEAYGVIDPEQYTKAWSDKWLQDYCAALMKKDFGTNISKFDAPLTGGVKLNGRQIYEDAVYEIRHLEESLKSDYSLPALMLIQ
jgi:hypothetical protein